MKKKRGSAKKTPDLTPEQALEEIKKSVANGRVVFASESKIDEYEHEVDRVLRILAAVVLNPRIEKAWVSDMTRLGDFENLRPEHLERLHNLLGFKVEAGDYLWEVASRLRFQNTGIH